MPACLIAAFVATNFESFLGATTQGKFPWLTNEVSDDAVTDRPTVRVLPRVQPWWPVASLCFKVVGAFVSSNLGGGERKGKGELLQARGGAEGCCEPGEGVTDFMTANALLLDWTHATVGMHQVVLRQLYR